MAVCCPACTTWAPSVEAGGSWWGCPCLPPGPPEAAGRLARGEGASRAAATRAARVRRFLRADLSAGGVCPASESPRGHRYSHPGECSCSVAPGQPLAQVDVGEVATLGAGHGG